MTNRLWAVLGLVSAVVACGSSGDGGGSGVVCGTFEACGGDVVGAWTITDACSATSFADGLNANLPPACAGAYRNIEGSSSGTLTYATDGTYQEQSTTPMSGDLSMNLDCYNAMNGTALGAAQLSAACGLAAAQLMASGSGITNASCLMSGGSCVCAIEMRIDYTASGTYTVSGSTITNDAGGSVDFCVQGSTLQTRESSSTFGDLFRVFSL